jgi:hypothetical protein
MILQDILTKFFSNRGIKIKFNETSFFSSEAIIENEDPIPIEYAQYDSKDKIARLIKQLLDEYEVYKIRQEISQYK